jgi:hypothetical protein
VLSPEYRELVELQLDACDAALTNKPNLAGVFDAQWRKEHREKMLNANSPAGVWYPRTYDKPHQELFYPPDYQQRLEEGAAILLPKFDDGERKHFVQRMRGEGSLSAEEELLLARGFAKSFGADAVTFPHGPRSQDRPEFHVSIARHTIEVEARGLRDSDEVRELTDRAIRQDEWGWHSFSRTIRDNRRIRSAVAKKLLSPIRGDGRIVVFTQYTAWPTPDDGVPLLCEMAITPEKFEIPADQHALVIAYVCARWIAAVWFNEGVASRLGLAPETRTSIRAALRNSFYPRNDGVFFDETQDGDAQRTMIGRMIRAAFVG